jgi:cytochrome c oxidase subunit 3
MPLVAEPEELLIVEPPRTRPGGPSGGGPTDFGPDGHGGGGGDDGEPDGGSGYTPGLSLLGMRLVLLSIVTLFIALAVVCLVRPRSPKFWQPVHVPNLLWLSTAIILASSLSLEMARRSLNSQRVRRYALWLGVTVTLGIAFLGSQYLSLRELIAQGLYLRHNPHSSMFFVITGVHGMHLLAGIAMLIYLLLRSSFKAEIPLGERLRQRGRHTVAALYWHCLDGIWIGMFVLLRAVSG